MKKPVCLFMIICMIMCSVPIFAEETTEKAIPDTWQEQEGFWVEEGDGVMRIMGLAVNAGGGSLVVPSKMKSITPIEIEYPYGTRYQRVDIPVQLAAEAFKGVEGISKITFEDGLETIPVGLCKNMKSLVEVSLPKSMIAIDNYAFQSCEALEKIDLSNVQHIGRSAFEGCKSLKGITLSNKINAIEDYAFKDCESLEKVEGLNANIVIGKDAFLGTKVANDDIEATEKKSLYSDIDTSSPYNDAINVLAKLGIMTGYDDGTFKPDITLTRAEAAAIIVRLLNLEINLTGETDFSDVPSTHWASGYICWATENGIINGQGDGTFAPEEFVTEHQLIKMLVCTLGYEPVAMANGGWMNGGYITAAEKIGLIEKDSSNKNVHIKRGEAALLCYNALDIDFMEETWYNCTGMGTSGFKILEGETILTEYWGYEKIEGVIKESAGKLLIKVTKTYADKSYYVIGQVFTFEDERLREFVDSIVTAYVKKTADAKNDILLVKLNAK